MAETWRGMVVATTSSWLSLERYSPFFSLHLCYTYAMTDSLYFRVEKREE